MESMREKEACLLLRNRGFTASHLAGTCQASRRRTGVLLVLSLTVP